MSITKSSATFPENSSALDLFELLFGDAILERLVRCTYRHAELKKNDKTYTYRPFKRHDLTKEELTRFLAVLVLLGIIHIQLYRQAWNLNRAQGMLVLAQLMSRHRFEAIASFIHIVSQEEELG